MWISHKNLFLISMLYHFLWICSTHLTVCSWSKCFSNPDATEVFGPTSPSSPHQAWWVVASGKGVFGEGLGPLTTWRFTIFSPMGAESSFCDGFFTWGFFLFNNEPRGILNLEIFPYSHHPMTFLFAHCHWYHFSQVPNDRICRLPSTVGKNCLPCTHNALRDFSRISMFVWERRNTLIWTHGLKKPGWVLVAFKKYLKGQLLQPSSVHDKCRNCFSAKNSRGKSVLQTVYHCCLVTRNDSKWYPIRLIYSSSIQTKHTVKL